VGFETNWSNSFVVGFVKSLETLLLYRSLISVFFALFAHFLPALAYFRVRPCVGTVNTSQGRPTSSAKKIHRMESHQFSASVPDPKP
jgi:hypothetical protein